MNKQIVSGDYKKWLLYSFDRVASDHIYDLYKSLESNNPVGIVSITKSAEQEGTVYILSSDKVEEDLQLTEAQREQLLKYIRDNYFQHGEIVDKKEEKARIAEIAKNHNFVAERDTTYDDTGSTYTVRPHPKETTYYNIKLVFSLLVYAVILGAVIYNITTVSGVVFLFVTIMIVGAGFFSGWMAKGIFIGMIKGNAIQLTEEQYPEIYNIIKDQAKKIGVEVPEIYIASGHFNAFVARFSRHHVMLIYSEVVETALKGDYSVLKYVTAHELCHIKQRHALKRKYLLPSAFVPFLSLAYSRGCEYTCDRVGYDFSPKGSVDGVLVMTAGKEIYSKINVQRHIDNPTRNADGWVWLSEKFMTHPHLFKRLAQIREYSKLH